MLLVFTVQDGDAVVLQDLLALVAGNVPSELTAPARRNNNLEFMTGRIAEILALRNVGGIILAMHDREIGERIHRATVQARPQTKAEYRSVGEMMWQLNPQERDLEHRPGLANEICKESKWTEFPGKTGFGVRRPCAGRKSVVNNEQDHR